MAGCKEVGIGLVRQSAVNKEAGTENKADYTQMAGNKEFALVESAHLAEIAMVDYTVDFGLVGYTLKVGCKEADT